MKRDPDLIRNLLNYLEDKIDGERFIASNTMHLDGYSNAQISYHLGLLDDAGYIHARETPLNGAPSLWIITRITWDGHEFIDAARDDKVWKQGKQIMAKTGSFAFEILKPILIDLLRSQLQGVL